MLNMNNLNQITDGDDALLGELLTTFFQSTREDILNLQAAVNNQQKMLIINFSHRIKGAAAIVGADQLAAVASDLEQSGQDMKVDRYDPLLLELQSAFKEIENSYQTP